MTLKDYFGIEFSNLQTIHLKYDGILYIVPLDGFNPAFPDEESASKFDFDKEPWMIAACDIIIDGVKPVVDDKYLWINTKVVSQIYTDTTSLALAIFRTFKHDVINYLLRYHGEFVYIDLDWILTHCKNLQ